MTKCGILERLFLFGAVGVCVLSARAAEGLATASSNGLARGVSPVGKPCPPRSGACGCLTSPAVDASSRDVVRGPRLRDVRLKGVPAGKMERFFKNRLLSARARDEVFGEARASFAKRDDDEKVVDGVRVGGLWRGEFWGKLMLGAARVADYLQDAAFTDFVRAECHRMIALQDPDGYLGSYVRKDNVAVRGADLVRTEKAYGWHTCWNLWNRKYCIWAMLEAYRTTGDAAILASVKRQAHQLVDMMHASGLSLRETGQPEKVGLPSMSLLKPLLSLYCETGDAAFLAYAEEMLPDWDRADGLCPNLLRNAGRQEPLHAWYPDPHRWAKAYEMMSCLDGLVEHYRVTGSQRSLQAVRDIRANLARTERNPLGSVGYVDQFFGAADEPNAATEICDVVHWIRLNLDLYRTTGDVRLLDDVEAAYFNAFLAGICDDGTWAAFAVRGCGCHQLDRQCGYRFNHCCVNNVPRTFMDMAENTVTRGRDGVFHVNFYQDAVVTLDGVTFDISGGYPVNDRVTVRVSDASAQVDYRRPAWCRKLDVSTADGVTTLCFDMNPRIVERRAGNRAPDEKDWHYRRFFCLPPPYDVGLKRCYRETPAATVMYGPLLLARSRKTGETRETLAAAEPGVTGRGYSVRTVPVDVPGAWGAWDLEFTKAGEPTIRRRACDFQSAGGSSDEKPDTVLSVWM